eukprot:6334725-Amphidinium_carterae.1
MLLQTPLLLLDTTKEWLGEASSSRVVDELFFGVGPGCGVPWRGRGRVACTCLAERFRLPPETVRQRSSNLDQQVKDPIQVTQAIKSAHGFEGGRRRHGVSCYE